MSATVAPDPTGSGAALPEPSPETRDSGAPTGASDIAQGLRARAADLRKTAQYAEANRDDWFISMPPEVSQGWLADAVLFERAASLLEERASR